MMFGAPLQPLWKANIIPKLIYKQQLGQQPQHYRTIENIKRYNKETKDFKYRNIQGYV